MTDSFTIPIEKQYFEDFVQGRVYEFGSITVSEEEIVRFAELYDPQTFHANPDLAKKSVFGGLIASGWPGTQRP